jgi:tetratricopeptide (TPR) repeat protein
VATLDPGRVRVAVPVAADPAVRDVAAMTQTAVARALGALPYVRLADTLAGTVVATNVFPLGTDSVRLDVRVLDASTGDLVHAVPPIRVPRAASDSVWTVALDPLLSTVAIAAFPWLGPRAIPLGAPPRYAAVRELLLSLASMARPDSESRANVRLHGERAVALDTTFLQAQAWRGAIGSLIGVQAYDPRTRALVDTVVAIVGPVRERLNPFESILYDFVAASSRGDQGGMLTAQRRLREIVPGAPVARDLPNRLLDVNRPREAIALLEQEQPTRGLDGKLQQPSEVALHWVTLADAYHYLGDYKAEREAAAQLRRLRPDIMFAVRYQLGAATALGDSAAVEELLAAARTLPSQPQSNEFFGDVALQTSQELDAHGHVEQSRAVLQQAMEWFESRRPEERSWRVKFRHAIALYVIGRYGPALDSLRPVAAEIGETNSLYLGLEGRIAAARGDTAEAQRIDARLAGLGNRLRGANTLERAFIASVLGKKEQAVALLQEAFAQGLGFSIRWRLHWFTDTKPLRGYPAFEKMLEPQG